ncbi:hypothetical protein [uncultured Desulfuromonas sp.]|uniref:hypothetical protein n=1 Tax=uncultured Desulfuromonas sp. TaxID=181013 RepID=UPI002AAA6F64|nr:hypothetical protein [uncultured Desulfuromonas sp.]
MKIIYYTGGPARLTVGRQHQFNRGVARPVSDKIAASLLAREDVQFAEADKDTPREEQGFAELETAAKQQDKADQQAAKEAAQKQAAEQAKAEGGN